ncbi:MAG: glycine--tRNA ligase [Clostridia bacterium]|nr:glycine--tRNA ligase [Clostridia bacterium]
MTEKTMDKIVSLCKSRGFIYPGSEIYGGLANSWDYGPLGAELKKNIKDAWWQKFIRENKHNVGIDAAIIMNPQVWVTTGHVGGFSDPLIDCRACKTRHRADKLIEEWAFQNGIEVSGLDGWSNEELVNYIKEHHIPCPDCGKTDFTDIRKFNLMFKTFMGVTEDAKSEVYLRPETAQGMFVNFKNVLRTTRRKMPMGIGQMGRSFRNEITPGNFIFRTREFEQMELEFFCKPGTDLEWYEYWKDTCKKFLISLGASEENLRMREHSKEELSFYSKGTTDIEYLFPFGWGELWGIADRTDYDLSRHMEASGEDLTYLDPETNEKYVPYCVEPAVGVDRLFLMFLCDAYNEEEVGEGDTRVVLKLHPALAPVKVAVLPLSKKLSEPATKLYEELSRKFMCDYDEAGSIGKRYRREDEIGTPFCVTVDFDTLEDNCVTIRNRDTMEQERIAIDKVEEYIAEKIQF